LYGSARVLFNRVTVQLSCPVVVFVAGATERGSGMEDGLDLANGIRIITVRAGE